PCLPRRGVHGMADDVSSARRRARPAEPAPGTLSRPPAVGPGASVLYQSLGEVVAGDAVAIVGDLGVAVRLRAPVRTEVHEHDLLDGQDALARDHVADLRAHGQRRAAEVGSSNAQLDKVTLNGGAYEGDT